MNTRLKLRFCGTFVMAVAVLHALLPPASAQALDQAIVQSVMHGRQLEKQGQWRAAGLNYYSALMNSMGSMSPQLKSALGRRSAACLTLAMRQEGMADHLRGEQLGTLYSVYSTMQRAEPNNPTWPYLTAQLLAANGRYVEARNKLAESASLSGGDPSVRSKAERSLSPVSKHAATSSKIAAAREAELRKNFRANYRPPNNNSSMFQPDFRTPNNPGSSGPSPDEIWNRGVAAQNAWARGDIDAQNRINSGGGTDSDKNKYGGW